MNLLKRGSFCVIFAVTASILFGCRNIESQKTVIDKTVIVIPENCDNIKKFAAEELKKHIDLITGKKIEIISNDKKLPNDLFPIYVGIPYSNDKKPLDKEEAR